MTGGVEDSERGEKNTLAATPESELAEFDRLIDEAAEEALAEEAAEDAFADLFEEAAKLALSKEPRRRAADKAIPRPLSRWTDSRPQWQKVGFTLRVVRQECNCGSIHSIIEGLYRNDAGRREGESRLLRLSTEEELADFSKDSKSPQWVETLSQGSVMCVECASDFGFTVPAAMQPAEVVPWAEWPWDDGVGTEDVEKIA